MRVCPKCRRAFESDATQCPNDGFPLIDRSPTFAALESAGSGATTPTPEPDAKLRPGMMVGEYRIEAMLAEGGMGDIYAAIHPVIRKRVGVKVLHRKYAERPDAVSRFVLEARSVNEIGHHNIVDIFSIGELDDGRNYMVMELLEGMTLHDTLVQEGKLRPAMLLPVFEQLCDALQAAHQKGFVHRDLKPDNVFVLSRPPRPFIKILDFGLAKLRGMATGHETQVGAIMGTPEYMAPEQCRGDLVDERTDVYALGVILYELVTGYRPFTHPSPFKVLVIQQTSRPPRPSSYEDIPLALEEMILKALAKQPNERQQSVREFMDDFVAALPGAESWTVALHGRVRKSPDSAPTPARATPVDPELMHSLRQHARDSELETPTPTPHGTGPINRHGTDRGHDAQEDTRPYLIFAPPAPLPSAMRPPNHAARLSDPIHDRPTVVNPLRGLAADQTQHPKLASAPPPHGGTAAQGPLPGGVTSRSDGGVRLSRSNCHANDDDDDDPATTVQFAATGRSLSHQEHQRTPATRPNRAEPLRDDATTTETDTSLLLSSQMSPRPFVDSDPTIPPIPDDTLPTPPPNGGRLANASAVIPGSDTERASRSHGDDTMDHAATIPIDQAPLQEALGEAFDPGPVSTAVVRGRKRKKLQKTLFGRELPSRETTLPHSLDDARPPQSGFGWRIHLLIWSTIIAIACAISLAIMLL